MNTYYITFGQVHAHAIAGRTYDRNCVASIEAPDKESGRKLAFEIFKNKWSHFHEKMPDMSYYPRGVIPV